MRLLFLCLFILPQIAACGKTNEVTTIREVPVATNPPTQNVPATFIVRCRQPGVRGSGINYVATSLTGPYADTLGRTYYNVLTYPSNVLVQYFGVCRRR